MKRFVIFTLIFACIFCITIYASGKLSPAIDILASENEMIKTGLLNNGEISFDTYDFDMALGGNISAITISTLPNENDGRLMLENLYVVENQVIQREDFSLLRFVFASEEEKDSCFTFTPNGCSYTISCFLRGTRAVNFSPVATNGESVSAWTQENISSYGTLSGYDPDNDELRFEIVNYPKKGLVSITDKANGDYKYTPYANATGTDTFTYRVRDSYGNYSEESAVSIKIDKLRVNLVFEDVTDDKYLNAILVVNEFEIMECAKEENGNLLFNPNAKITKEEFIYLVMTAMGAKDVPVLEKTRFADDSDISSEYKGYVESAVSLGIISGKNETDGLHLYPKQEITVAEAGAIINKIIGAKAKELQREFKDGKDVPTYAKDALQALNALGIIKTENGNIKPNSPLTRAQTAQILMSLLQFRQKIN